MALYQGVEIPIDSGVHTIHVVMDLLGAFQADQIGMAASGLATIVYVRPFIDVSSVDVAASANP